MIRKSVEDFVIHFFEQWDPNTSSSITNIQRLIDDVQNEDRVKFVNNFIKVFNDVVGERRERDIKSGYIMALLILCRLLDAAQKKYTWYTFNWFLSLIVDKLENVSFDAEEVMRMARRDIVKKRVFGKIISTFSFIIIIYMILQRY